MEKDQERKIALIGFGTVATGFLKELVNKKSELKDKYDLRNRIVAVANSKRSLYTAEGLDPGKLIKNKDDLTRYTANQDLKKDLDPKKIIEKDNVDTIIETTWTDLDTGEPGYSHIKTALKKGKNVITSNKGPLALNYFELSDLARSNNAYLRYEATVMAGTPTINLMKEDLAGCNIKSVRGILNGTTNYVLSKVEKEGWGCREALQKAQELGYAEEDPSADIEGWDTVAKAAIISNTIFDKNINPKEIDRQGIGDISIKDVKEAKENNSKIKLIANLVKNKNKLEISVKPEKLTEGDPLSQVDGASNALSIDTDHLGSVDIIGSGAGGPETGQAILNDLIRIEQFLRKGDSFKI